MKKAIFKTSTALLASALLLSSIAMAADVAEEMPASYIVLPIEDAVLVDDDTTQDLGGNGTFIGIVDGYGCGNSSLNDCVVFNDIDFGENGADQISILFGYGNDNDTETTLSIAIDDEDNVIGDLSIGHTGGWEIENVLWNSTAVSIPSGVHTVYIRFSR